MHRLNKLTATKVASLSKPGQYGDGGGLYLQVSAWGTKSWLFRYKGRWHGLGALHTFTLKQARERARKCREMLADGIDPIQAKRQRQQAEQLEAAKSVTFREAATRYITAHRPSWKNAKHAIQWPNSLERYVYPIFGDLPVSAIDVGLVLKVVEPIWTEKTETANRVRGRIEAILDWATVRGYRAGDNPARWKGHLENVLPAKSKVAKVRHFKAMPYSELPTFMAELRDADSISAKALEFTILTAARTSEVIGARWEEIEGDVWTIPAERMKAVRQHRVPLSKRAIEILKSIPGERGSDFIFPGARTGKPLSNMAMLELLRGMRGNGLTTHGFRSTFKDWCSEMTAYPNEISEAALGHVVGDKVERAYRRGDALERRRRLMADWSTYCSRPAGKGEVVSIREAG